MEKDPSERIQSAMEVAERLAPWASDDNLLIDEEMDRPRWMPEPVPSADNQDTDPGIDVAEMAITEMTGLSDTSLAGFSSQDTDHSVDVKPPVPTTVTEQFSRAGRLQNESVRVSITTFVLGMMVMLALGVLIGFLLGYFVIK